MKTLVQNLLVLWTFIPTLMFKEEKKLSHFIACCVVLWILVFSFICLILVRCNEIHEMVVKSVYSFCTRNPPNRII
jgi:hypothetical protein